MRYSFHLATFASRSIRAPPSPLVKPEPFVRPFVIPVRKERRPFTRPFVLPRVPLTSPFVRPRVPLTSPFVRPRVPLTSPFVRPRRPFTRPFVRPVLRGGSFARPFVRPRFSPFRCGIARGSTFGVGTSLGCGSDRVLGAGARAAGISGSRFFAFGGVTVSRIGSDGTAGGAAPPANRRPQDGQDASSSRTPEPQGGQKKGGGLRKRGGGG